MKHKEIVAISIPTGIGAEIGGFAGDGGKIAKMFSKHFSVLTHPNVVNGGILSGINSDILYTEGFIFDEFFKGNLNLVELNEYEENTIGVIFDKSIPYDILSVHINTINAMREVKGLNIPYYEITDDEVGIEFYIKNGISTGTIKNEKTLFNSAKKLLNKGCSAIGVVCYFRDDITNEDYENGVGIDPIAGIEAVISHYLSKELNVPIAHAPAFSKIEISKTVTNSKVASENISSTYLPCILEGLNRAPKIDRTRNKGISYKDIKALIIPYRAFGGIAPLCAHKNGVKILSVKNETFSGISCEEVLISDIIMYNSYKDCLDAILKGNF